MDSKQIVITKPVAEVIAKEVSGHRSATRLTNNVVDGLMALNVTSAMMVAPGKDEDRTFYDSLKVAIVAGFTQTDRTLLAADTRSLSEAQKIQKRYAIQQVGSTIGRYKRAMLKRESAANPPAPRTPETFEAAAIRRLSEFKVAAKGQEKHSWDIFALTKAVDVVIDILSK